MYLKVTETVELSRAGVFPNREDGLWDKFCSMDE